MDGSVADTESRRLTEEMDGSLAQTESRRLTEEVLPGQNSNDQAGLVNPLPDVEAGKYAGSKPTQTPEERKATKIARKWNNRKDRKDKFDRLMKIASEFGGIDKMESELQRLEQLKSKHGGLEEIDFKLSELDQMEAESDVIEKVKDMFRGIDNIIPRLKELKKAEFKQVVWPSKPNQTERPLLDLFPTYPDFHQEQYNHGPQPVNPNNQGSTDDGDLLGVADYGIGQIFLADTLYSDADVTRFIFKLEENTRSNLNFTSFKDLDGERQKVEDYSFPMSLVSTVKAIIDAHGDVTKNCLLGPSVVENTYILLSAAIKEMGDLSLEQVTEEIMLKWRDAIKDAKRIGCNVEFAWKHLETIAYASFGLKAQNDWTTLEQREAKLMADVEYFRQELEKKEEEVKALGTKEEVLTSRQCKWCLDCADRFQGKNVGLFG